MAFLACASIAVQAQVTIKVVNAQGPTQSMTPQVLKLIDEANRIQTQYRFVIEFKPGAFESIGINTAVNEPETSVVTVTPSMIEAIDRNLIDHTRLTSVFSLGDACWAVITNFGDGKHGIASIKRSYIKEITVGGPAIGGVAHLVALEIGARYSIPVRYVVYRSNYDALLHMTADNNSVNMVMDRLVNFDQLKTKNPKLQVLGVNCAERHPGYPGVPTLQEQKIFAPYIWHHVLASKQMSERRREDITKIMTTAIQNIGKQQMFASSDFISPIFYNQSANDHYQAALQNLFTLRQRYRQNIRDSVQ